MLNPESVILNSVQNLFRAGPFEHLKPSRTYETLKRPMKQVQGMVQGDNKEFCAKPLEVGPWQ
jgi:hypothetical protein